MPPLDAGLGVVDGPGTAGPIGDGPAAAADAPGGAAPAEEAGAADAEAAAAAADFFAGLAPVCASTSGRPKDAPTSNGAIRSMGTTTAAQTALCQRILDPFFPLFFAGAGAVPAR